MNAQGNRSTTVLLIKDLRFHTLSFIGTALSYFPGAKVAYVSLNIPTACPPRTAVSVNRPFRDRHRCWAAFGHEFDKVCDLPDDVAVNRIFTRIHCASRNDG